LGEISLKTLDYQYEDETELYSILTMGDEFDLKICCMGAGYVGGPTMAVIAYKCPKVRR
jgi:UDP-glucose/GDP-mannose dehydrogenase family, NAD binding domain